MGVSAHQGLGFRTLGLDSLSNAPRRLRNTAFGVAQSRHAMSVIQVLISLNHKVDIVIDVGPYRNYFQL